MGINEKKINFEKRKKIYDTILKNPGLHLREINRKLDLPFGTLRYHLDYLKKRALITTSIDKGFLRFYATGMVGNGDKKYISVFRQEMLRNIIMVLVFHQQNEILFKENLKKFPYEKKWFDPKKYYAKKHRTTIDFYFKKLVDLNILEEVKLNGHKGYRFNKVEDIYDFLIRYKDTLSNKYINHSLKYWNDVSVNRTLDVVLDVMWDIMPHPYHI